MADNQDHECSKKSNKLVTRRSILRSTALVGGLNVSTQVLGTADATSDEVEIVTHKSAGRIAKTKFVPRSWKEHLDLVRDVRDLVANNYQKNLPGVKNTGIISSDDFYGGKRGFAVEIEAATERARKSVPDSVQGIPIKKVEPTNWKPMCSACYNEGTYDLTPGGVEFNDIGSCASIYYLDYDNDDYYEKTMLTAAHVVGSCSDQLNGNSVNQGCESWGEVVDYNWTLDAVACNPTADYKAVDDIIQEENDTETVVGHVTESGLAEMQSSGETTYKTGKDTGTEYGVVKKTNIGDNSCMGFDGHGIKVSNDVTRGDSGGAIYDIDDGDAYMMSVTSKGGNDTGSTACDGDPIYEYTKGPGAYEINNRLGGFFKDPNNMTT